MTCIKKSKFVGGKSAILIKMSTMTEKSETFSIYSKTQVNFIKIIIYLKLLIQKIVNIISYIVY